MPTRRDDAEDGWTCPSQHRHELDAWTRTASLTMSHGSRAAAGELILAAEHARRRRGVARAALDLLRRGSRLPAVPSLVAVVIAIAIWQAVAEHGLVPAYILPLPAKVLAAWTQILMNGALMRHVSATLSEALFGFAIAFVAGIVLAYPLARSETLSRLASPFIATTQAVPMIALAPLLVMWFGLGLISKVVICALIVFFPILVNAIVGLQSVDREMIDAARTMGANAWQTLLYVEAPLALRPLLAGVRMGLTLAMTGAIVGEFVASDAGLGFLMILSRTNFDASMVFAAALTIAAISTLSYKLISGIERVAIDW